MVKVRGRNSNRKTVKQTAKKWHVRAFVTSVSGATSQSCKVTGVTPNVPDQPESVQRIPAVINLSHPVEFKTISEPRMFDAWHQ